MKTVTFERSAEVEWTGVVVRGSGSVHALSGAFTVHVSFPTLRGEPVGVTTPEELLAASYAVCFGIGLRSVLARNGACSKKIVRSGEPSWPRCCGGFVVGLHVSVPTASFRRGQHLDCTA